MRRQIAALSLLVACLTLNSPVLAVDRLVPGQYPTIQAGINAAQPGDMVIVAPGIYTGSGNKNLDFAGKAITVRSTDPNDPCVVETTVIHCQSYGRGFYFHSGEEADSILAGFTIKRGIVRGEPARGGGIFCSGSSPTIANCVIVENTAHGSDGWSEDPPGKEGYGGGICCVSSSNPLIIRCTISNNLAIGSGGASAYCSPMDPDSWPAGKGGDAYGGGIYYDSTSNVVIESCTINNNLALAGNGGDGDEVFFAASGGKGRGGGIFGDPDSNVILSNCTISGNNARGGHSGLDCCGDGGDAYGGGIYGNVMINNSVISDNSVQGGDSRANGPYDCGHALGAGIFGSGTIKNSIISGNQAYGGGRDGRAISGNAYGGGMYCNDSSSIVNCLIVNNLVEPGDPIAWTSVGGGILCGVPAIMISNCTIVSNIADDGGGIRGRGTTTVINCILWGNGDDLSECSATYSCIEDSDPGTGNIHSDPCFVSGPSGYYYLSQIAAGQASNSACVDAGSDLAANLGMDIFTTRADQIGDAVVVDMGYHYPMPNPADIDGQGDVDFIDYAILASQWRQAPGVPSADIAPPGGDGKVDEKDLAFLVKYWLWGK